jgi:AraC-like DNA-binding protein
VGIICIQRADQEPYVMPNSAVQSFADPWEFQASFRAARTLLTAPGKYQSKLTRINMQRLWMHRAAISLPLVAQVAAPKGRTSLHFLADAHQTPIWQNGVKLLPGVIVLRPSGTEHYCRTSTRVSWGSMSLAPEELAAAGKALVDYELTASPATPLIRPPAHLMSRLLKLHEVAGRLAATVPDILAHPEVCRAMEHELVHLMVRCLAEGLVVVTNSSRYQRQPVMRRFEGFLAENPNRTVYLAEVCRAIGVSERTLRLHCEEHLGMGPCKYLWLRRMNLTRRRLAAADPTTATVTTIALDHGFGELGRFAVAYRELFGESPLATLRSAPNL